MLQALSAHTMPPYEGCKQQASPKAVEFASGSYEHGRSSAGDVFPIASHLQNAPGPLAQENGPFLINATGGLMRNPYAWTKQANLLILESWVLKTRISCLKHFAATLDSGCRDVGPSAASPVWSLELKHVPLPLHLQHSINAQPDPEVLEVLDTPIVRP